MADTTFVNATTTVPGTSIVAAFLNDVNTNTYTQLAAVAGTNAITATGASTVTVGYPRGVAFRFLPIATNTGPATININGLGVKNITKFGTAPLTAGDLLIGSWAYLTYDGVQFQLINAGGPLTGVDTYVTTAGTTTAYTLTFQGSFGFFAGYAVKLIFNGTNTSTTPTLNVNGSGAVACKVMDANGNKIDPIVGAFAINTPATAIYDGVNWLVVVEYPSGRLLNVQKFSASGTYTPTPGTTRIIVEAVGGGGQGGGPASAAAGQVQIGAGGGAGGYSKGLLTSGFSPTAAIVIGAGGSISGSGTGQSGGNTTFGTTLVTASGGVGGVASTAGTATLSTPAAGGTVGTGNIFAFPGMSSIIALSAFSVGSVALGGVGASSPIMSGYASGGAAGPGSAAAGMSAATYPGAGGGGGAVSAAAATGAGGAGGAGILIVYEYS